MIFLILILILLFCLKTKENYAPATNQTIHSRLTQYPKPVRTKVTPYPPPWEMITFPTRLLRKTIPPYEPLPPDGRIDVCPERFRVRTCSPSVTSLPRSKYSRNMFSEITSPYDGEDERVNRFISTTIPRETPAGSF